jgi:hypothetical protein
MWSACRCAKLYEMNARKKMSPVFQPLPAKGLQRRASRSNGPDFAPPVVHEVLRSSGQSLDSAARAALEPRFGHDFSRVRVHSDARAAESARAVGALAYTVGRDIVFDSGCYAPRSTQGQRLLAHELAHVVQQDQDGGAGLPGPIRLGEPDSPAEAQAQSAAQDGVPSPGAGVPAGVLQRVPNKTIDPRRPPWSARRHITAGMGYFDDVWWSTVNAEGHYATSDGSDRPFSQVFTGQLCTKEPLPLDFAFHVDVGNAPRPQPFGPSRVAMTINFLTAKGKMIPVHSGTSSTHYFNMPGMALLTSLPVSVSFVPSEPGALLVSLVHSDPSSGELAVYSDEIPVADCPWNEPPKDDSRPTRFVAVIPDPVNKPDDYHLLTPQDGLDQPGEITPIERDTWGYFYRIKGKKQYIADPE